MKLTRIWPVLWWFVAWPSFAAKPAPPAALKPTKTRSTKFLVFGDGPYNEQERKIWERDLPPWFGQNRAQIAFAFHVGDMKGGGAACSEAVIQGQVDWLDKLNPGKMLIVPGDNDWTDCDRDVVIENNPAAIAKAKQQFPGRYFFGADWQDQDNHKIRGISEIEALATLRKVLSNRPLPKLENFTYLNQHHESFRLFDPSFAFVGLHFVGTNNGWSQLLKDKRSETVPLVWQREMATLSELKKTFAEAKQKQSPTLIIGVHADMFTPKVVKGEKDGACTETHRKDCSGSLSFKLALQQELKDFAQPVLLIHGDSTEYCLDQPWQKQFPQFWRLNGPGDGLEDAIATIVSVDASHSKAPFSAVDYRSGKAIPQLCDYK